MLPDAKNKPCCIHLNSQCLTTITCTLVFRDLFCRLVHFMVMLPLSAHTNAHMCSCWMPIAKLRVPIKCPADACAHRYRNGCPTQRVWASDGFNNGSDHGYVVVKKAGAHLRISPAPIFIVRISLQCSGFSCFEIPDVSAACCCLHQW